MGHEAGIEAWAKGRRAAELHDARKASVTAEAAALFAKGAMEYSNYITERLGMGTEIGHWRIAAYDHYDEPFWANWFTDWNALGSVFSTLSEGLNKASRISITFHTNTPGRWGTFDDAQSET